MNYSASLAVLVTGFILTAHALADAPPRSQPTEDPLRNLRAGHPRLLVLEEDLQLTRRLLKSDPQMAAWHAELTKNAQKLLDEPPVKYQLIGPRLLSVSRAALSRITLLAGLYRLDGNRAFADRAVREMLAVCAFEDWHPPHFLDTAEMTAAVAIGYDWLFDVLTPEQRKTITDAIISHGLEPGLQAYAGQGPSRFWVKGTNNWNQVCNGGLTMGALAIADDHRDIARNILENARRSLPVAMNHFLAPDGGCEEGPSYWSYATLYTAFYLSGCQTALGTDFGFLDSPGLADAGRYRIQTIGPLERTFNYADGHDGVGIAPQMYYFARAFDRTVYAAHEREFCSNHPLNDRSAILGLLWAPEAGKPLVDYDLPTAALFRGVNVAIFRSGWGDSDAVFVGFKGGDNQASHAHLDLGTFVLDALGQRWALDLGPDDYNLPGYWGKTRWTYYRLKTEGHNTLTIDSQNQALTAKAPIIAFRPAGKEGAGALAVADLSAGYPEVAKRLWRGISLMNDGRDVLVQDEVELAGEQEHEIAWNFHTAAEVAITDDGRQATLRQGGRTLYASLLSPSDGRFETISANPPPPQAQQPDVKNLVVRVRQAGRAVTIAVLLSTRERSEAMILPLDAWVKAAPITKDSR